MKDCYHLNEEFDEFIDKIIGASCVIYAYFGEILIGIGIISSNQSRPTVWLHSEYRDKDIDI